MTYASAFACGISLVGSFIRNPLVQAVPIALVATAVFAPKFLLVDLPRVCQRSFRRPQRNESEQAKFHTLTKLVNEANNDLIMGPVTVTISGSFGMGKEASCIGSTWSLGGPLIRVKSEWLEQFEAPFETDEERNWFKAMESELNDLPNNPAALVEKVKAMDIWQQKLLLVIVDSYDARPSEDEMKAVIRRELGRAVSHHFFRSTAALSLAFFIRQTLGKFAKSLNWSGTYSALSFPLVLAVGIWTRQDQELEADAYRKETPYKEGLSSLLKRQLILELKMSWDALFEGRLENEAWHPSYSHSNAAKRLVALHSSTQASSPWKKNLAFTLAVLGIFEIIRRVGASGHAIYRHYWV